MKIGICIRCHRKRKLHAKGLCESCYNMQHPPKNSLKHKIAQAKANRKWYKKNKKYWKKYYEEHPELRQYQKEKQKEYRERKRT